MSTTEYVAKLITEKQRKLLCNNYKTYESDCCMLLTLAESKSMHQTDSLISANQLQNNFFLLNAANAIFNQLTNQVYYVTLLMFIWLQNIIKLI